MPQSPVFLADLRKYSDVIQATPVMGYKHALAGPTSMLTTGINCRSDSAITLTCRRSAFEPVCIRSGLL